MKGQLNGSLAGMRSFFTGQDFSLERDSLWTGTYTLVALAVAEFFLYTGFLQGIENFGARFGPFLAFLILAIALNTVGIWYVRSIRSRVPCMLGCMAGMTLGMTGGFTLGAVVGATNGMLVGSLYGLLAGGALGVAAGRCCGTMGTMEGMMAGLMGGFMGAMTSLMLISENVFIFLGVLMAVSAAMVGGLMKIFRHQILQEPASVRPPELSRLLIINLLLLLLTTWLIAFGPRSVIVASISWGA